MDKYQKQSDLLEELFKSLPEEELPQSFRTNVMRQVMRESEKAKRRGDRLGFLAVILATVAMITLAVAAFSYMDVPKPAMPKIDGTALHFYFYIGIISLFLLLADYKLRRLFRKDE